MNDKVLITFLKNKNDMKITTVNDQWCNASIQQLTKYDAFQPSLSAPHVRAHATQFWFAGFDNNNDNSRVADI
jgi:hypothetical protein